MQEPPSPTEQQVPTSEDSSSEKSLVIEISGLTAPDQATIVDVEIVPNDDEDSSDEEEEHMDKKSERYFSGNYSDHHFISKSGSFASLLLAIIGLLACIVLGTFFAAVISSSITLSCTVTKGETITTSFNETEIQNLNKLDIRLNSASLYLYPTQGSYMSVVVTTSWGIKRVAHTVAQIENDVFVLRASGSSSRCQRVKIELYVPVHLSPSLFLNVLSTHGDVFEYDQGQEFLFSSIRMETTTGNVTTSNLATTGNYEVYVNSGQFEANSTRTLTNFTASSNTGNITVHYMDAAYYSTLSSGSGSLMLHSAVATKQISLKTYEGNITVSSVITEGILSATSALGNINMNVTSAAFTSAVSTGKDVTLRVKNFEGSFRAKTLWGDAQITNRSKKNIKFDTRSVSVASGFVIEETEKLTLDVRSSSGNLDVTFV